MVYEMVRFTEKTYFITTYISYCLNVINSTKRLHHRIRNQRFFDSLINIKHWPIFFVMAYNKECHLVNLYYTCNTKCHSNHASKAVMIFFKSSTVVWPFWACLSIFDINDKCNVPFGLNMGEVTGFIRQVCLAGLPSGFSWQVFLAGLPNPRRSLQSIEILYWNSICDQPWITRMLALLCTRARTWKSTF